MKYLFIVFFFFSLAHHQKQFLRIFFILKNTCFYKFYNGVFFIRACDDKKSLHNRVKDVKSGVLDLDTDDTGAGPSSDAGPSWALWGVRQQPRPPAACCQ